MRSMILGGLFTAALACVGPERALPSDPLVWNGGAPAPYAQALVERTLARHPDLRILAFHVTPPGRAENMIVASNIGRIGKVADGDDLQVIQSGASRTEQTKTGYSVELVLFDASHRPVGALGTTFAYTPGEDVAEIVRRAAAVRDELAAQIPDLASLFASMAPAGGGS